MSQSRKDRVKNILRRLLGTQHPAVVKDEWHRPGQTSEDLQRLETILRDQKNRPSPPKNNQATRRNYAQSED